MDYGVFIPLKNSLQAGSEGKEANFKHWDKSTEKDITIYSITIHKIPKPSFIFQNVSKYTLNAKISVRTILMMNCPSDAFKIKYNTPTQILFIFQKHGLCLQYVYIITTDKLSVHILHN